MKNIKLIIFDLDGTLVDAYKAIAVTLNRSLKHYGFKTVSGETVRNNVGHGDKNFIEGFFPKSYVNKALSHYRKNHMSDLRKFTRFLPGAKRTLRALHTKGYRLAIASNRPTFYTKGILKSLRIDKRFDYVLCADKIRSLKPSPDILNKVLSKFKLNKREALYVGDMAIDVQTGKRAGIVTVAVLTGSSSRQELKKYKPYKMLKRIDAMIGIVEALEKQFNRIGKAK